MIARYDASFSKMDANIKRRLKPTIFDIALHAGVSTATVDRVLNTRPGVRQKTIDQIEATIEHLQSASESNSRPEQIGSR